MSAHLASVALLPGRGSVKEIGDLKGRQPVVQGNMPSLSQRTGVTQASLSPPAVPRLGKE